MTYIHTIFHHHPQIHVEKMLDANVPSVKASFETVNRVGCNNFLRWMVPHIEFVDYSKTEEVLPDVVVTFSLLQLCPLDVISVPTRHAQGPPCATPATPKNSVQHFLHMKKGRSPFPIQPWAFHTLQAACIWSCYTRTIKEEGSAIGE
jgi:hypothetical protein